MVEAVLHKTFLLISNSQQRHSFLTVFKNNGKALGKSLAILKI
jgi:hypothetical protein